MNLFSIKNPTGKSRLSPPGRQRLHHILFDTRNISVDKDRFNYAALKSDKTEIVERGSRTGV